MKTPAGDATAFHLTGCLDIFTLVQLPTPPPPTPALPPPTPPPPPPPNGSSGVCPAEPPLIYLPPGELAGFRGRRGCCRLRPSPQSAGLLGETQTVAKCQRRVSGGPVRRATVSHTADFNWHLLAWKRLEAAKELDVPFLNLRPFCHT